MTRYTTSVRPLGSMQSAAAGEWVKFSDIESLLAEHERLKGENAELRETVEVMRPGATNHYREFKRAEVAESRVARLQEAVRALYQAARGDAKGEWWTVRKWLDEQNIYHDDLGSFERLVEQVCRALVPTDGEKE